MYPDRFSTSHSPTIKLSLSNSSVHRVSLHSLISMPCIDIHHHYFPPDLQATKNRSNVALGWQTPPGHLEWSPEVSLRGMDELGIDISILSYPAISHGCVGEDNREAARARNTFASEVCKKYPSRFGFFACLPFLDDIKGLDAFLFWIAPLEVDSPFQDVWKRFRSR